MNYTVERIAYIIEGEIINSSNKDLVVKDLYKVKKKKLLKLGSFFLKGFWVPERKESILSLRFYVLS